MGVTEEMAAMVAQHLVEMAETEAMEEMGAVLAQEAMVEMAETEAMEEMGAVLAQEETVEMEEMAETEAMEVILLQEAMEETEATVEMAAMEAMAALAHLGPTEAHPLLLLLLLPLLHPRATSSLRSAMVRFKHPLATLNPSLRSQTVRSRLLPEVLVVLKVLHRLPLLVMARRTSPCLALDASSRLLHHPAVLQLLLPARPPSLVLLQASASAVSLHRSLRLPLLGSLCFSRDRVALDVC
jgi:hypothetical protein